VDKVKQSVMFVRTSVSLNLTTGIDTCMDHDHGSPGTESQGHRSRSRVRIRVEYIDWQ